MRAMVCREALIQPMAGSTAWDSAGVAERAAAVVVDSVGEIGITNVPVLGVVENMSGFVCPKCGEVTQILPSGGGRAIATSMQVPFLGAIPMDPKVAMAADSGLAFMDHYADSPTASIMKEIVAPIAELDFQKQEVG